MAPAIGRSTGHQRRASSHRAHDINNDFPSSIRAVQTVSNLSSTAGHLKPEDRESFEQLLSEILSSSDDGRGDGSAIETNLVTNYNLVSVVARAGLEILVQDDPFVTNADHFLSVASRSLAVLKLVIGKVPGVLFYAPAPLTVTDGPPPPLYVWLLPRLLALIGRPQTESLQDAIVDLLGFAVRSAARLASPFGYAPKLVNYLKGCIRGMISSLEDASFAAASVCELRVPAEEVLREVDSRTLVDSNAATGAYSFLIRDPAQACMLVIHLVSVVCSISMSKTSLVSLLGLKSQLPWSVDQLSKVRRILASSQPGSRIEVLRNEIALNLLLVLVAALRAISKGKNSATNLEKIVASLVGLQVLLLRWPIAELGSILQTEISIALALTSDAIREFDLCTPEFDCLLLPAVYKLLKDEDRLSSVNQDLQVCTSSTAIKIASVLNLIQIALAHILRSSVETSKSFPALPQVGANGLINGAAGAVSEISSSLQELQMDEQRNMHTESTRPQKRRRITNEADNSAARHTVKEQLIGRVFGLLGSQTASDLDGLHLVAEKGFAALSTPDRCSALRDLGLVACAAVGNIENGEDDNGSMETVSCLICDSANGGYTSPPTTWEGREQKELVMTLKSILKNPEFQNSTQPRIWAMLSIGRLVRHSNQIDFLDLASSYLGRWCLHSLQSSLRELRLAAGQALPVFLTAAADPKVLRGNRLIAIDFLRKLSDQSETALQETCIRAWGQIAWFVMYRTRRNVRLTTASICNDEELNIVLLRLVEYLGHTNSLVHGVAYDELSRLAERKGVTPVRLLEPFWRSIGVAVVKDLHTRPQTVQLLSDLLGVTVDSFLNHTQTFILPYLVLYKKQDVIKRIVQACGRDATVWSVLTSQANLPSILALLLLQESFDADTVLALFQHGSEEIRQLSFTDLVELAGPFTTAFELLKATGDTEDSTRVSRAITHLANISQRTSSHHKSSKKGNAVGAFFDFNVLGIVNQFSDTINGLIGQSTLEKKRCLRGIEEMIKLGRRHISNALPQIGACLQSAMLVDDLRDEAFSAWITMMMTLDEDDVETMIESTYSIVVLNWQLLQPAAQERVIAMLDHLFEIHSAVLMQLCHLLPSLASIPEMARHEAELNKMKSQYDVVHPFKFHWFTSRCQHENVTVVNQALKELLPYLQANQSVLHQSAVSEQPDYVLRGLFRSLLDACVKFAEQDPQIASLSAQCIGLVGCLDSNTVEVVRNDQDILVMHNFEKGEEAQDWVIFFLQEILVKSFMSATNPRSQGFLGYAMQEFLKFCGLDTTVIFRGRDAQTNASYRRWIALPEAMRNSLAPFLASRYVLAIAVINVRCTYPIFPSKPSFSLWLRTFVLDLLQKGHGDNARDVFAICSRVIRNQDISIADFLLPFVALNVVAGGSETQAQEVGQELLEVLNHQVHDEAHVEKENLRLCSETVFRVLDYFSKWTQEKKKQLGSSKYQKAVSASHTQSQSQLPDEHTQLGRVEQVLKMIPADVISRRAVECKSFARALFQWERYIRQTCGSSKLPVQLPSIEPLYVRLQDIYTQIDEPDGIEGISAHLQVLNIDQQILEHRKAGRWMAAQSWFELQLAERPNDIDVQVNLLSCLKESGQHDVLLNHIEGINQVQLGTTKLLPFVAEAAWATGKWGVLERYVGKTSDSLSGDFNVNVGHALLALYKKDFATFEKVIGGVREHLARGLSRATTASLQACHDDLLKLHVLSEIELISGVSAPEASREAVLETLDHRLPVLGTFLQDKQYLLSLRRATMQLSRLEFQKEDLASAWLTSAQLARKGNFTHQSFNATMHAAQLGADSAKIEHSRLLWSEGHHRKAIQSLEGAIKANAFKSHNHASVEESVTTLGTVQELEQNYLTAKAHLLLAKWLDSAGQTHSQSILLKYQEASKAHLRWEKGHYYIGRHYNKLYESEKALPANKRSKQFSNGETARLVCSSYIRALPFGSKYVFQTVPRVLTLWLDLGSQVEADRDQKAGPGEHDLVSLIKDRQENLESIHKRIEQVLEKGPAFMFYTAFAQIIARICHPNRSVANVLQKIIVKLVTRYPQQTLWSLLAVVKSSSRDRAQRGISCLTRIKEATRRSKSATSPTMEMKALIQQGQKLTDFLLGVCEGEIHGKPSTVSLSRDLGFNHKCAPCPLVVPLEKTLFASVPTTPDGIKSQQPFSRDTVTISSFLDEVVVLHSLQRPRKISVRGSDGRVYGLLCKPKDDLRKDQRLMEFNAMINRSLKRDADSSKRRLYIKTYAVTPLNEECGLIEWVDNLRTFRDIVLQLYKSKGVVPNYGEIKLLLEEACSNVSKLPIFEKQILPSFPPVFHQWFVEMFPEPGAWFNARLRYTRSCAVMSMVGMVLGLGDRHGENILFEEGSGGTFHVDFNCLFDKGLTFEKPEKVPFRLTHNMVDAFGVYGYEGPFRKSCELTLKVLRQNEESLMTILETFVYDPTTDFIGKKKRPVKNVPETPQDVLDSVRGKVRGLLAGETVSLSVEGHVDELIRQAVSARNLAAMYIGWCAFF